MKNHFILKLSILVLFLAAGTFLFVHYGWYAYFSHAGRGQLIQLIKSFSPFDVIVFIGLQVIQVVFSPIPGEATGLIGGFLYGPILGTIYSTIGLTIGSWLAFVLARVFGLPFVERAVRPEIIRKYDYVMERQGVVISFILFVIPGFPKDFFCYLMGLSYIDIKTFMIISTSGRLLGTIILSCCGYYARQSQYFALLIAVGISGVFILLAFFYRERLLAFFRTAKTHRKPSQDSESKNA